MSYPAERVVAVLVEHGAEHFPDCHFGHTHPGSHRYHHAEDGGSDRTCHDCAYDVHWFSSSL
jgi:hypothetical protein